MLNLIMYVKCLTPCLAYKKYSTLKNSSKNTKI